MPPLYLYNHFKQESEPGQLRTRPLEFLEISQMEKKQLSVTLVSEVSYAISVKLAHSLQHLTN